MKCRPPSTGTALGWLADSLRQVGEYASTAGVQLNVENHMDTMATSAEMTMAIVRAVDLPNVGVLYDQANLAFMNSEVYEMATALQGPRIHHVHVKDFYWAGTERIAAVLGKGIVPWAKIVNSLTDLGYEGYYSLEYERRWYPDQLPPPAAGHEAMPGLPAQYSNGSDGLTLPSLMLRGEAGGGVRKATRP